jgi:hypothetical protein
MDSLIITSGNNFQSVFHSGQSDVADGTLMTWQQRYHRRWCEILNIH